MGLQRSEEVSATAQDCAINHSQSLGYKFGHPDVCPDVRPHICPIPSLQPANLHFFAVKHQICEAPMLLPKRQEQATQAMAAITLTRESAH